MLPLNLFHQSTYNLVGSYVRNILIDAYLQIVPYTLGFKIIEKRKTIKGLESQGTILSYQPG